MIECTLQEAPLDAGAMIALAAEAATGATTLFVGTARNTSSARPGSEVVRLEYEAYVPMAEKEICTIADETIDRFGVLNVLGHHRMGSLALGEAAVVVVISAPHRAAAFDGCRYVIEELKKRVPIWKKE